MWERIREWLLCRLFFRYVGMCSFCGCLVSYEDHPLNKCSAIVARQLFDLQKETPPAELTKVKDAVALLTDKVEDCVGALGLDFMPDVKRGETAPPGTIPSIRLNPDHLPSSWTRTTPKHGND